MNVNDRAFAEDLVLDAIRLVNAEKISGPDIPLSTATPLYGPDSVVDSLGLITIVSEVESKLAEAGHSVNLMSDDALAKDALATVASLRDYIEEAIG